MNKSSEGFLQSLKAHENLLENRQSLVSRKTEWNGPYHRVSNFRPVGVRGRHPGHFVVASLGRPSEGGRWSSVTINTWLSQAFCRNNGNLWWGMTPEPVGSGAAWSSVGMMKGTSWLDGWPRGSGPLPMSADDLPISDGLFVVCVCVVAVLRSDVSFRLRCRVKNWLVNRKKSHL